MLNYFVFKLLCDNIATEND